MDTAHTEALIGMLTVLALLVLMVLPAVIGIARDRRIDRQLRRAEAGPRTGRDAAAVRPGPRKARVTA
ncbi:hypothetical protein ACFYOV_04760 [Streptomyces sp. NPDC005931]|uniref:hypothetical protein n=1 Tax=Streptomyces sp. NPDC005931 TaxID=3364737 RepID=UPI0036A25900